MAERKAVVSSEAVEKQRSGRVACTIIAKNYLAYARVLSESYLALHPEDRFVVLVVDDYRGYIEPSQERFELIGVEPLGIPHVKRMAFKYNVTEWSTSVKPFLLEYLIEREGATRVLYLDPDILVTSRLTGLYDALEENDIVLTPHLEADYPDDGKIPNDSSIMVSGMFNLGFIGVRASENTTRFLKWWQGKLADRCVVELVQGYFVDQKYIDLVPFVFEGVHVERHPGYNMAYWNLHSRWLSGESGSWSSNGRPLCFYHFSGFNPVCDDGRISKYLTRYDLSNRSDLVPLFEDYRARVLGCDHLRCAVWPYGYGAFAGGGAPISDVFRRLYRTMPAKQRPPCFEDEDPFTSAELQAYYRKWYRSVTPSSNLVFRAARRLRRAPRRLLRELGFEFNK